MHATCTSGPTGETIFMRNIHDVHAVTGVPVSCIRKAMPENIEAYHKKVRSAPPPS